MVQLSYQVDSALAPSILTDPVEWEHASRQKVGLRSCQFSAEFNAGRTQFKVAAALLPEVEGFTAQKISFRVVKQLADIALQIEEQSSIAPLEAWRNGRELLVFLLRSVFGIESDFRLRAKPVGDIAPVFLVYGSTKAAGLVHDYRGWAAERGMRGLARTERSGNAPGCSATNLVSRSSPGFRWIDGGYPLARVGGRI